jgi:hypothetical protein
VLTNYRCASGKTAVAVAAAAALAALPPQYTHKHSPLWVLRTTPATFFKEVPLGYWIHFTGVAKSLVG